MFYFINFYKTKIQTNFSYINNNENKNLSQAPPGQSIINCQCVSCRRRTISKKIDIHLWYILEFCGWEWLTLDQLTVNAAPLFWCHLVGTFCRCEFPITCTGRMIFPRYDNAIRHPYRSCSCFASGGSEVALLIIAIEYCSCFFQCTSCATKLSWSYTGSHGSKKNHEHTFRLNDEKNDEDQFND
jgi:hypothetical protein